MGATPRPAGSFFVPTLTCSLEETEASAWCHPLLACLCSPPRGAFKARPQWAPPSAHSFLEDDSLYLLKESEAKFKLD